MLTLFSSSSHNLFLIDFFFSFKIASLLRVISGTGVLLIDCFVLNDFFVEYFFK
jgi:hypothetical protein